MGIYLDNACTSSPKPPCVAKAVAAFLSDGAFNVNRGSYEGALDAEDAVLGCRELLAGLLGALDPADVMAAMEPKTRLVIMTHASAAPAAPRPPVASPWSQVLSSSLPLPLRTRLGASTRRAPLKGEPWRLLMHEA